MTSTIGRGGGQILIKIDDFVLKKWRHGEGGVKDSKKLQTSFMDGPKEEGRQNNGKLSRLSTTAH